MFFKYLHMLKNRYNGRIVFYLLFTAVQFSIAQSSSGKYPIQNFTPMEYKAGIQNIDFAQNRDMTLFVANNLGVLSFNGNEWRTHDFRTGKKKRALAFDEQHNRLYVGSQGEFGFFEEDWHYVSLIDKIPEDQLDFDEVWDVFLVNERVYFCTFRAIYVYDGESVRLIEHEAGLERSFSAVGKFFTQTQQGKLLEVVDEGLTTNYPQGQSGQVIAGIVPEEEGYLLFYKSGAIELTTPLGVRPVYDDLKKALTGTYVNHVLQLSDTRLVVATQTSGLYLYDRREGILERITVEDGLQTNACLRSFQDYSGNLWVGMQNGIALIYINSPMRLINREINLQGSGYEAYQTEAGTYYTTSNGIYFLAKNTTQSRFLPGTEGPAYGIQEIAGKYYAGHHTGLFILEGERARHLAETDGLWQVKQLRSRPDYAVGGTYSGLDLFRIDENRTLQPVQKISGFSASSRFFEEDREGRIWVGQYYRGLYQLSLSADLSEAQVIHVSADTDLPIKEQIILNRAADGFYLAANTGIYALDPTAGQVTEAPIFGESIGEQPVYLFAQDQKNNVHVLAENAVGFFRQISTDNYLFVPSSLYQLRYHLNNDLLHVSMNVDDGVFFSANEGFIHYDPGSEDPLRVEQPLIVRRVYSVTENKALYKQGPFDRTAGNSDELVVSPRARVMQIDVESFQFNDLNNQQFRYFLKGFDEDFGEWTNASTKEYTNLKEGNYEFIAQTRNYLGKITASRPLSIIVEPPFHRSPLAKGIYIAVGVLSLVSVSRFQKGRYKRKTREIEASKQLELAKKQQKLIHIEQQKEKELLQLKEEKMESELQHVNKLLAASTLNLVVKNEFIETIREGLKEVKQQGKSRETKVALEKIVKEIDITLRLQKDWEDFEHHFDKVHGDFLSRLRTDYPDLSPNDQKLSAFLRLNLNTKEIANLLSISLRGVEVARYRLRKKLGLETGQNLSKFILEY